MSDTATVPARAEGATILELIGILRPVKLPAPVYPFYVAARIRRALSSPDEREPEQIIDTTPAEIEPLGDCKYAVRCRDFNGEVYRVTVMLESEAVGRDAERERYLQFRDALAAIGKAAEHYLTLNPDALTVKLIASLAREAGSK